MSNKRFLCKPILAILLFAFLGLWLTAIPVFCQQSDKVKEELFREVNELIKKAKDEEITLLATSYYFRGMEFYSKALAKYEKRAKLKDIQKDLKQAKVYFMQSFQTAKISQVALEAPLEMRKLIRDKKFHSKAPEQYSEAERQLQNAIKDVERDNLRSAQSKIQRIKHH